MKKFIITIDTEGDNLWEWKQGTEITTNNIKYLPRFQNLCNKYDFKPVWLSNWEVINNDEYVKFIKDNLLLDRCELGMHLHAWNTPPYYELPFHKKSGAPYLIEYPKEIMEKKVESITERMNEKFGFVPSSHRAGRWAINDMYFKILKKYGYKYDCSITPGIDWRNSVGQTKGFKGPDYRAESNNIKMNDGIVEIPVSTYLAHKIFNTKTNIVNNLYHAVKGKRLWIRPNGYNLQEMKYFVDVVRKSDCDYIMFMLHSSEMMPGGSPTFRTEESIEKLYMDLKELFNMISKDFEGVTLSEYIKYHIG